ncbi:glucose-6-phosphate isomerase [Aliidiomarina indica]|uniref:glucose-6-phosphate isomerase n=1 Tax=Aliidiomarina indica TaxID=2749147 RepID=UPI0018903970|nr:glucose-6-phosphate isomerase [Aliidiomarina indica]
MQQVEFDDPLCSQTTLNGLVYDWSYQFLTPDEIKSFAKKRLPVHFKQARDALLTGTYSNPSENREVTHVLSRSRHSVLREGDKSKFAKIVRKLRSGKWLGATGKPITDIVNIGVGGSDLGPLMASFALREFATDIHEHHVYTHFVSSMDGGQLYAVLPICDPETTLFIVASKSFGTIDTFANVDTAREWMLEAFEPLGLDASDWFEHHIIGVSANAKKMDAYGIPAPNQLVFPESIGGRFSLWSAIGLSIATTCGVQVFQQMLEGARLMDEHFASAPVDENIPMLMALIGVYNREEREINNLAILPYDGRFRMLPSYLQQLDMESNGKQFSYTNQTIDRPTGPIVWGGFGPNGQHAFFQHLHQGYDQFTADFVLVLHRTDKRFSKRVQTALAEQQRLAVANCLAHRRLMAFGSQSDTPSEHYPGGHPTSLLALRELTPESFGAIVAAYEHKIFVQGLIWGLNSFDQPGVEQGKKVALDTFRALHGESLSFDPSTDAIIKMV